MLTLHMRHHGHTATQPQDPDANPGDDPAEPAPGADTPLLPEQPTAPDPQADPVR